MGKSDTPPAPDYVGAAKAQGAENMATARTQAQLNNPNITNPYGKQTVTFGTPGTFDQAGYDAAMGAYNTGMAKGGATGGPPSGSFEYLKGADVSPTWVPSSSPGANNGASSLQMPTREQFTAGANPDVANITQSLSPDGQALFDQQNRVSAGLGNLAEGGISRVGQMLGTGFDTSQLPSMVGGVNSRFTDSRSGDITRGIDPTQAGIQSSIDPRFDQSGQQVADALYRRQTAMLDPQYQQQEDDMTARLANQGIMQGSEAYEREIGNFGRSRQTAYGDARDRSILAAGQEQSRINDLGLSRAGLNNSAQGQEFGQNAQTAGFNNQAVWQMFGQDLSANNQNFGQDLAAAQFQNQTRQQGLQEGLTLRQLPLNEINALRTGAQVNIPQFQQYTGGGQIAPAPIYNAAQQQAQWNQGLSNANTAANGQAVQAGVGLASAAAMMF